MRNLKKMLTLGVATAMLATTCVAAFAAPNAGTQVINQAPSLYVNTDGETRGYVTRYGSADIQVNGYMNYGVIPVNSDSETVPWGDLTAEKTHQLLVTAPTYLEFTTTDKYDEAMPNLAGLTTTQGTILNSSAYLEGKKGTDAEDHGYPVSGRQVQVLLNTITAKAGGEFTVTESDTEPADYGNYSAAVSGLHLTITDKDSSSGNTNVAVIGEVPFVKTDALAVGSLNFKDEDFMDARLVGTMQAGQVTNLADGATEIHPTVGTIKFIGDRDTDGVGTGNVQTFYKNTDARNNYRASFVINLFFRYVYQPDDYPVTDYTDQDFLSK